eukprot:g1047.t1
MSSPRSDTSTPRDKGSHEHVRHVDDVIEAVREAENSIDLRMEKTPIPTLEGFKSLSGYGNSSRLASLDDEEEESLHVGEQRGGGDHGRRSPRGGASKPRNGGKYLYGSADTSPPDQSHAVEDMLLRQIEELDQKLEHIAVNSPNSPLKGYYGERFVTNETIPGHTYGAGDSSDWDVYSDDEGHVYFYNSATGRSQWEKPFGVHFDEIDESDFDEREDEVILTAAQRKLIELTLNPRQKELLYLTMHPEEHAASKDKHDQKTGDGEFWDRVHAANRTRTSSRLSQSIISDVRRSMSSDSTLDSLVDKEDDENISAERNTEAELATDANNDNGNSGASPNDDNEAEFDMSRRMTMPGAPPRLKSG